MNYPDHGVLTFILPFVEQDNIYKAFTTYPGGPVLVTGGMVFVNDPQPPTYWPATNGVPPANTAPWWKNVTPAPNNNLLLGQSKINIFVCPSDDPYSNASFTMVWSATNLASTAFDIFPPNTAQGMAGRTNYVPNCGMLGFGAGFQIGVPNLGNIPLMTYIGPLYDRSKSKLGNMYDGTSNTILFGESLGDAQSGPRNYAIAWMGAGGHCTWYNLPAKNAQYYQYSSRHTGVVQFGMADGSVQRLRTLCADGVTPNPADGSPSWQNFQRVAGMQDGQVIDYNTINF